MMKNSIFAKSAVTVFTTAFVVGAYTYSSERYEPKRVDLEAFKNAAANLSHLSQKAEIKTSNEVHYDVTASIVNTIEKEVKGKIRHSRYALNSEKVKRQKYEKEVIAKNWNDIRPEFAAVDFKVDELLLKKLTLAQDAGEFEINNNELIKLYGFSADSLKYDSFSNVELASFEAPAVISDEVKTAQASATTKVLDEVIKDEVSTQNAGPSLADTTTPSSDDDLVMFDYSDKTAQVQEDVSPRNRAPKMFDAPLSSSVKEAIDRELHKNSKTEPSYAVTNQKRKFSETTTDEDLLKEAMEDEDALVFDYSKESLAAVAKTENEGSESQGFTASKNEMTTQAEFVIRAREINLSTQKVQVARGYEFVPDYDRSERTDDGASGEIKLGYSLTGDVNTQTGIVQAQGLIPTRVELNLLEKGINVPLLSEVGIQSFLQKKQTEVTGNLLMVAVDPSILDVEIDSSYQYKLYFNQKFKMMDSKEGASYVLFLGVKTGNFLLRYLLSNKESAQKIIYIGDGEMYFEDPDFQEAKRELYTFTTRSLLGRKVKELNINGSDISIYGSKTTAKKKALNAYEIKVPEIVNNSRKYLEFKHLGTSLFVGTSSATEMEIPGRDFIGRVLDANEMSELGERCMVQVNLSRDLRDIKVNGKNKSGEMFVETSYLDRDGNFSRDNFELSEKVFVSGDMEGIFNIRLDYTDGSTDFLKTFCSEGSYLIEQL